MRVDDRPAAEIPDFGGSSAPALSSLLLSAASLWLGRLFTTLHWEVLFGDNREGIAQEPLTALFAFVDS